MATVDRMESGLRRTPRFGGAGRMLAALAGVLGVALAVGLIRASGPRTVAELILRSGWWLALVIVLHTPQTLCSALGWGALLPPAERPSAGRLYLFRWIRESVNSLLPVAQIGGEVVRARLLAREGFGVARAGASCALDVTLELAAQVVFTLIGVVLLAGAQPHGLAIQLALASTLALGLIVVAMAAAQRLIGSERTRTLAARLLRRVGRPTAQPAADRGRLRASARQQAGAFSWHLASWLLGALETWAALHALGLDAHLREALVVESLCQVVRAAAFAAPGGVGLQEGGFVLVCGLFGAPAAAGVALSLLRRLREVALGAPGLLAWRVAERERAR